MTDLQCQFSCGTAIRTVAASACLLYVASVYFWRTRSLTRRASSSTGDLATSRERPSLNLTASINETYLAYNARLVQALVSNQSAMLPLSYDDDTSWTMMLPGLYAYSAYVAEDGVVRIVSLAPRSGELHPEVVCLVHSEDAAVSVRPEVKVLEGDFNFSLRAAAILCRLNETKPRLRVTLTRNPTGKNLSWIKVTPSAAGGPVEEFSVCYQPLRRRRVHIMQLAEFISYYTLLGVSRFTFYLHEASTAEEQFLLRLRARKNVTVVLLSWTLTPKDCRLVAEAPALHDCLYRYRFRTKYVVFADMDEHIVLKKARTLKTALRGVTRDPAVSSFVVAQKPYCTEYRSEAPLSELHPPLLARIYKEGHFQLWPHGFRSKWIAKPEDIVVAYIHYIPEHVTGKKSMHVRQDLMVMYHYRKCADFDPISHGGKTYSGVRALRGRRERGNLVDAYVDDILNSDTFSVLRSLLGIRDWSDVSGRGLLGGTLLPGAAGNLATATRRMDGVLHP